MPASAGARLDVLGVGFDRLDLRSAVDRIDERLARGQRTFVITANPEFVMLARVAPDVAHIAREAELVVPDGTGILVAARLLGDPLPGRAPGRLIVDRVVPRLAARGLSLFLLGAAPGVAEQAAASLRRRCPDLRIAGTFAGAHDADDEAVALIAAAAPDAVFVAFGMPRQERWIARNLGRVPSVRLAIGVGGVFDQLAGVASVPPALVHRLGFEWLWRLARDPQRWRRQRVLPIFALRVLAERLLLARRQPSEKARSDAEGPRRA